jgi:hypothetical protein
MAQLLGFGLMCADFACAESVQMQFTPLTQCNQARRFSSCHHVIAPLIWKAAAPRGRPQQSSHDPFSRIT